jgi:hypothetical protein
MTRNQRLSTNLLRVAAVIGLPLLLATTASAQSKTEDPAKEQAVAPSETPAPAAVDAPAEAPSLNRDVKQDLSKSALSPESFKSKEEHIPEQGKPAMLQPFVEPEAPATPQP